MVKTWRLDAQRFIVRDLEGESIVLDLKSGNYFTLEGAGALALRLFMEGRPSNEVVDAVFERFQAPDRATVEEDIKALLRDFEKKGILTSGD